MTFISETLAYVLFRLLDVWIPKSGLGINLIKSFVGHLLPKIMVFFAVSVALFAAVVLLCADRLFAAEVVSDERVTVVISVGKAAASEVVLPSVVFRVSPLEQATNIPRTVKRISNMDTVFFMEMTSFYKMLSSNNIPI